MQQYELSYLDYYLPEGNMALADMIGELADASVPAMFGNKEDYLLFTESILELNSIRIERQLTEADMLGKLISGMFDSQTISPGEIDLIIMTKESGLDPRDNLPKFLQYRYKMHNAHVLNITGNHCANVAVAWNLANTLGVSVKNIIILSAFRSQTLDQRVLGSYGILSDGAGLLLLSRKPGLCSLIDSVALSNGMLYQVDLEKDHSLLHLKYTVNSIRRLLDRTGTEPGDIRMIIPQNANILLVSNAVMENKMDIRKIFMDNIGRCGHIDSVDMILNLKDVLENGMTVPGDRLLSLNIGWAGSYVSSLLAVN